MAEFTKKDQEQLALIARDFTVYAKALDLATSTPASVKTITEFYDKVMQLSDMFTSMAMNNSNHRKEWWLPNGAITTDMALAISIWSRHKVQS